MENSDEEQNKEATNFGEFYFDLIDNHRETFTYYLSETAVLDWFGQTVKGAKKISEFLKKNVETIQHHFPSVKSVGNIGCRDTHVINYQKKTSENKISSPTITTPSEATQHSTPPNLTSPTSSKLIEKGQGDGLHNLPSSPIKKCKLEMGDGDSPEPRLPVKFISSDGKVEFHRSSSKKLQQETKWSRPCILQVAYSSVDHPVEYTIHLIIYQSNVKCRRNLFKDFEKAELND